MFGARQAHKFVLSNLQASGDPIVVNRYGPVVYMPAFQDAQYYWPSVGMLVLGPVAVGFNHYRRVKLGLTGSVASWLTEI